MIGLDGSNVERPTNNERAHDADCALSPDGKKIAFTRRPVGEDAETYRINANGGDGRLICRVGNDRLSGGGRNTLNGGKGEDRLYGQEARDRLNTGDGVKRNDLADGGARRDAGRTDRRDKRMSCPWSACAHNATVEEWCSTSLPIALIKEQEKMLETQLGQTRRAGRTVPVAAVAMLAVLSLVWCIAVIGHLYCLRRGGLDVCCVDD